jgi:D-threonate/D-erythronate kinase
VSIVRVVADDLTGALDAAAPFVATTGPLPVFWEMPPDRTPGDSFVLDSETRDASGPRPDWIDGLEGADLAFKKIDSLLRGRTVEEIAACLKSGLFESALIAPAFPAQQRITRGGRQYWRVGARDTWQLVERDLMAELRRRGVPVQLASSGMAVAGRGFFLCDATTEEELRAIVAAGRRLAGRLLWIGTAGLARALAGAPAPSAPPTLPAPLLLVIGSHHRVTLAQVARLAAQAPEAMTTIDLEGTDVADAIGAVAAALDAGRRAALVFALPDGTGGEVAGPLFDRALNLACLSLPMPGSLVVSGGATLLRLAPWRRLALGDRRADAGRRPLAARRRSLAGCDDRNIQIRALSGRRISSYAGGMWFSLRRAS